MAWALHELGCSGWGDAVLVALERYRREPDRGEEWAYAPSYLAGECGIALVGYRLTGDAGLADRVHELVLANLEDEWNELLWGAPGSLLAAEAMLAWTGEQRWEAAWDALADEVGGSARGGRPLDAALGTTSPATSARTWLRRKRRAPSNSRPVEARRRTSRRHALRDGPPSELAAARGRRGRTRSACSGVTARPAWSRRSAT